MLKIIFYLILIALAIQLLPIALIILAIYLFIKLSIYCIPIIKKRAFERYERKYYCSEEFLQIKRSVNKYVSDCNELNSYIDEINNKHIGTNQTHRGSSSYYDNSNYNYLRPEFSRHIQQDNVYNCSRTVCDNARMNPFKYVCKYFDISFTEENLQTFENLLNQYESTVNGMYSLEAKQNNILISISNRIPKKIKKMGYKKFQENLGFHRTEFNKIEFLTYKFLYVSPGGNASTECDVEMNMQNLNDFILFLSEKVKFRKSVAVQRLLMTSKLRNEILTRDNYTCKNCKNSISKEPNLLLEIDHIIPLSKGGMTEWDNLQTLCWKCNRAKGSKIL